MRFQVIITDNKGMVDMERSYSSFEKLCERYLFRKGGLDSIIDADYDPVETPVGDVPMSQVVSSCLSEAQYEDLVHYYANEMEEALENEWSDMTFNNEKGECILWEEKDNGDLVYLLRFTEKVKA